MQKAKKVVENLTSHDGRHDTTVDEDTRRPVTEEHVRPQEHESVRTAVEKEIHRDHHHTTVQPVQDKETLPEKHTHKVLPTEHKTFEHGGNNEIEGLLQRDAAKYKDTSAVHDTKFTSSEAPVVSGERWHHHVHEHVQPVIEKETVAPKVVHTTAPVHETHQATAAHHGTKVLPPKTMEEFTGGRGSLESSGLRKTSEHEGCPTFDQRDLESSQRQGVDR
ncbi:hypothetical protein TRIATDRAFT_32662 [Trichoderma atroviride IMI 206040]|uniref:Allergen n=1 Tax=Hypocrea atroviridis (strain ATCC 20476 / IMI 206040) TaxID=452589 RepID=G9P6N3_HYPAI|nr:uncharacterized protein TRIATDRAFT_32662 [Trichoderma atroviride IMI 206040]EHK41454.1 hypothetical protein TRIATDRAFT_32662 [Trichoderma atroviride IMI 206040]